MCRYWGTDPGAPLEPFDDVLAYNLRVGLAFALNRDNEEPEMDEHAQHVEAARAGAERIKQALSRG